MKRTLISVLLLVAAVCVEAQEKKWEHNLYVAGGLLIDREWGENETGLSMKLGYGLNYYFSKSWSLMPGIAVTQEVQKPFTSSDGGDEDNFTFLDVPVVMQFHTGGWTFGLGPVFRFCISNDRYYIDAITICPEPSLNDKEKLKTLSFGLQPSIKYQLSRHFLIGVEGNIGLTNVNKPYDNVLRLISSKHLHSVVATVGFRF